MFIQNVSIDDIKQGRHFDCGDRAVLIQICDPAYAFPKPKHKFQSVHQFDFLDVESDDPQHMLSDFAITDDQAAQIVNLLKLALIGKQHVIVHCHAGMCRSGAVADVGILMGFQDTKKFRLPNRLVKRKMMAYLGWTYDANADFQPLDMTDSGIIIDSMSGYGG